MDWLMRGDLVMTMTYRNIVADGLIKTKEAICRGKFDSNKKIAYSAYIEKALKLMELDRVRINELSNSLSKLVKEKEAVKPKSGIFYAFCGKCGYAMQKTDNFCPNCGKEVDWDE